MANRSRGKSPGGSLGKDDQGGTWRKLFGFDPLLRTRLPVPDVIAGANHPVKMGAEACSREKQS
jgi:hypothetical protein